MKITNRYNLPEAFVRAAGTDRRPINGQFSATQLIAPVQINQLKAKHWEDLETDVSDRLWSLLGTSVHYIMDKAAPKESITEEEMHIFVGDTMLTGRPDILVGSELHDYKVTSVWSLKFGIKSEWEKQLNVYAYLFRSLALKESLLKSINVVNALKIYAILRDWSQTEGERYPDYPPIPFVEIDIPLWPLIDQEAYIQSRIAMHSIEGVECTPEERWERPTTYAVMQEGRKSAVRVKDSQEEAQKVIDGLPAAQQKKCQIQVRRGSSVRCEHYCVVSKFCPQYSKIKSEQSDNPTGA